ncbi:MAG TPA: hypothetical protein P5572_03635, partial [Phycisphaerae bacterium]|nr:hypothetical protein [Phycisphaerae bacterium]
MSRDRIPSYRHHKPTGQAVVTIGGKDTYLGKYGTAASRNAYARAIAEHTATGGVVVHADDLTVSELLAAYWKHAQTKYGRRASARSRLSLIKRATTPLRKLYGRTEAGKFGPLGLRAVRAKFTEADYSRKYVNDLTAVVVRLFKWAASMELIPVSTYQSLVTVGGLSRGSGEARETEPVKPAPVEHVNAVKSEVSRQVAAMIDLQTITGMRPGEVVMMRACDLDVTGELWTYRPQKHKTEHFGIERVIVLGPQAQKIIGRFMAGKPTDAYLFSPIEAEAERREALTSRRKTPKNYGNGVGTNRKRRPKRKPREHYTTTTYARAVRRACEDLEIPRWSPNQL